MVEYSKVNVKLSDTQLKKIKTAVKDKTGTTLRISFKMFDGNDLPHELLLATRQKKLRNKSVLIPLGLIAEASAVDAGIHKNIRIKEYKTNNIK